MEFPVNFESAPSSRFIYLSKELNKLNYQTIILGYKNGHEQFNNNPNYILSGSKNSGIFGTLIKNSKMLYNTIKILRKNKEISTLVYRGYNISPLLIPVAKIFGIYLIYDFHGFRYQEQISEGGKIKPLITRLLEKLALSFSDKIMIASKGIVSQLPISYDEKSFVFENGVDLSKFDLPINQEDIKKCYEKYELPLGNKILGFVGSVSEHIDIEELFNLEKMLRDDELIIIIDGAGNIRESRSDKIKIIRKIPHEDVVLLLHSFDVCIIPYNSKWFGAKIPGFFSSRKVKEYLASGKPILIPKIAGGSNNLDANENYLAYEPNNPEDIIKQFRTLTTDKSLYNKISENNKKKSRKYSWEGLLEESTLKEIIIKRKA